MPGRSAEEEESLNRNCREVTEAVDPDPDSAVEAAKEEAEDEEDEEDDDEDEQIDSIEEDEEGIRERIR